jgi:type I restriction enzyme S subunit
MERYDSYKDSKVEWLGDIPSHWTNLKLGYLGKLKSGNGFSNRLQGRDNGDYPFFKVSDTNNLGNDVFLKESNNYVSEDDYLIEKWFLFPKNTIVFPKIGMVLLMNKRRILDQSSFIDNNMMGFIPNGKLNYKYGYYYLTKVDFKDYCSDGTVPSIGEFQINPIKFPLPPLFEQQQIVSYLDTKTSLTDSLIEKTQRKIELLKKKRTSLINEVVTKGLNPNVEMKYSGVEWIGEIPSRWETKKLKHISDVRPSNVDKHIYEDEIQVHLCNYTDVYYNEIINSNTNLKKGSCNENEYEKFKLEKGDVIITKDSETPDDIGIPVYVEETLENVVCGYHLTMIKPISVTGKFIFRFIECDRTRRYFELSSNGVTRFGLGKSSIENLVLPIPSETEQQQIVEYLDEQTQIIDKTISIEEKRIELLKEYRQSLISEVVTGKRKVVE